MYSEKVMWNELYKYIKSIEVIKRKSKKKNLNIMKLGP